MTSGSSRAAIHQVLVTASPHDAITNLAFATRALLREIAPSEIFAWHIDPELSGDVQPLQHHRPRHTRDVLIFHASIGQRDVHEFLMSRREPLVLVYHNITPGRYFEPYDPDFARLLTMGREEVARLRSRVVSAIADSEYNARELDAVGYRDVRVVPPVLDVRRLSRVTPCAATVERLATMGQPILLAVGQILPHKRPDFLVQVMHVAQTYMGMPGNLLLVGHHRLERYARSVAQQVLELNLSGVHLLGAVDEAELAAMFRSATLVLSASEHEGFCLPLLEAMTFEKPIVARAAAAVPETVAGGALLLPVADGPVLFAEAVTELLSNAALQESIRAGARRRLGELADRPPALGVVEALLEIV